MTATRRREDGSSAWPTASLRSAVVAASALVLLVTFSGTAAAQDDSADPTAFRLTAAARELKGQRSARTTRFRLPGTGRFAEVATGRPMHYRDSQGRWRKSQADLAADGADRVAATLPFGVRTTQDGLFVGERSGVAGVTLLGRNRPTVSGRRIHLHPPGQRLNWHFDLSESELKMESNPVARRTGAVEYAFPYALSGDLAPLALDAEGRVGNGAWSVGAPVLLGADGEQYTAAARWQVRANPPRLVLQVDDSTLPIAAFPYRIDPPIGPLGGDTAQGFTTTPFTGNNAWSNPSYALTNNNSKAKSADLGVGEVTQGLWIHGFGFDLYDQAVVTGVSVTLDRSVGGCGGCTSQDCIVEDMLYITGNGSTVTGANKARSACWPTDSNSPETFGTDQDPWPISLSVAQVESSSFGPILSARTVSTHGGGLPDAEVDFVGITVYWRQPDLPAGQIYPDHDTFLRTNLNNTPQGDETYLRIDEAGDNRTILRWSNAAIQSAIADLGGGSVTSATLRLYVQFNASNWGSGQTVDIHRLAETWAQDAATWNCPADTNTVNQTPDCALQWNGGGSYAAATQQLTFTNQTAGWVDFNVLPDVQAFQSGTANHGWLIKRTHEHINGQVDFTSMEGTAGFAPRLILITDGATATPTPSMTPTRTATRTPTSTATRTATATATRTVTPTATASQTSTVTRTPTVTDTFTPVPTDTPTATVTPTGTATATTTVTPTATDTFTPTATATPTTTATPTATDTVTPTATVAPGVVIGEVFDDGTALPLADYLVRAGDGSPPTLVAEPRYAATVAAGSQWVVVEREGYTRSWRQVAVPPAGAVRARDARVTALAPAASATGAQQQLTSALSTPAGEGVVTLDVASGIPAGADVHLTPLSPQGVIAPVPLGWSVLAGVDMHVDPAPSGPIAATVRIPKPLVVPDPALALAAARWDDGQHAWVAIPAPTVESSAGVDSLVLSATVPGQIALLVADDGSGLTASDGQVLAGIAPQSLADPTGSVVADPEVIFSHPTARARVFAEISAEGSNPSSGVLVEASLFESYETREGGVEFGAISRQDLAAYQIGLGAGGAVAGAGAGALALYLDVAPSRGDIPLASLLEGRIAIATDLSAVGAPQVVGSGETTVSSAAGTTLTLPSGAASAGTVVTLTDARPGDLPAEVSGDAAFVLDVTGGALDPAATATIDANIAAAAGELFVLARTRVVTGQSRRVAEAVAFGLGQGGGEILIQRCRVAGLCLSGLGAGGAYVIIRMPNGIAAIHGTVADSAANPEPDQVVEGAGVAFVALSDAAGAYLLPLHPGTGLTALVDDRRANRTAQAAEIDVDPDENLEVDFTLAGVAPRVIDVDPPVHAGGVNPAAVVWVTFSEPIDVATVGDQAVHLTRRNADGSSTALVTRLSWTARNTVLVVTPEQRLSSASVFDLTIEPTIADRQSEPLGEEFRSDFSTDGVFRAAGLSPGTLFVSLPEREDPNNAGVIQVAPEGATGSVFICGAAALARPGTVVDVTHYAFGSDQASGLTATVTATDADGTLDPNTNCATLLPDALYEQRCLTETAPGQFQPGSFCVALPNVAAGDRFVLGLEDAFGNRVEIDAGNMRDERTGAEIIGPDGGTVTFEPDHRYRALIPKGAFDQPVLVELQPIEPAGSTNPGVLTLDDPAHPEFQALADLDTDPLFERIGAVDVRLTPPVTAAVQYDVSVPALADASTEDQYYAVFIDEFDGTWILTPIDTAFFDEPRCQLDPAQCVVQTDPTQYYPGLTTRGTFGIVRSPADGCMGNIVAYTFTASTAGLVETDVNSMKSRSDQNGVTAYPFPVPCNTPVTLTLRAPGGAILDVCSCTTGSCLVGRSAFAVLDCRLSDDTVPPELTGSSARDGADNVDPTLPLSIAFSEPIETASASIQVTECAAGDRTFPGRIEWSEDRKTLVFVPDIRLPYGKCFRTTVLAMDDGGNLITEIRTFRTFDPRILQQISIDARDVVVIDPVEVGRPPHQRFIAIAEGDGLRPAHEGGIQIYDVTDLNQAPVLLTTTRTSGLDRALKFEAGGAAITTTGSGGATYPGPFLYSVNGGADRFGELQIHDLSQFPTARLVATRYLNFSQLALNNAGSANPEELIPGAPAGLERLLRFVPVDTGVPLDVASFGTDVVYVANTPHIGLQAVVPNGMNSDAVAERQVDGTLRGNSAASRNSSYPIRAVDTLANPFDPNRSAVVAFLQGDGGNQVLLVDPQLVDSSAARNALVRADYPLGAGGPPLSITALPAWPVFQPVAGAVEQINLVAAIVDRAGVALLPVSNAVDRFAPEMLENGPGFIKTTSGDPQSVVGDPSTQELLVADGLQGLSIVDLRMPGGSVDREPPAGVDDRIVLSLPLSAPADPASQGASSARAVDRYRESSGRRVAAVAAGRGGLSLVETGLGSVRIEKTVPDLPILCPGCQMTLYASVSPPNAPVTWSLVQAPEQSGVSLEPNGLAATLMSSPDDEDAALSVRVALTEDPQQHDRRDIHLFKVSGGILGDVRDALRILTHATYGVTPKEAVVLLFAGAACRRAMEDVNAQYGPDVVDHFSVPPFPTRFHNKNGPGNAMHHAYVSCIRVKKCGTEFARQLGDSHEQFGTNKCSEAAMDLHNNAVGIRLGERALSANDCGAAVREAFGAQALRWLDDDTAACGSYSREFVLP